MCVVLGGSVLKPRSEGMEALQLLTSSACCHRNAQLSCTGRKFPLCRKGTTRVMPDRGPGFTGLWPGLGDFLKC